MLVRVQVPPSAPNLCFKQFQINIQAFVFPSESKGFFDFVVSTRFIPFHGISPVLVLHLVLHPVQFCLVAPKWL
jgi:hypothetical protein